MGKVIAGAVGGGVYLCVLFLLLVCDVGVTGETTSACYGTNPACDYYSMSCPSTDVIRLGDLDYGYDNNQICKNVSEHCTHRDSCCVMKVSDCAWQFSREHMFHAYTNCSGRAACSTVQSPWHQLGPCQDLTTVTTNFVSLDYECEPVADKLSFCGNEYRLGNSIDVILDGSKESFNASKASKECACRVTNPASAQETVRIYLVDVRLQTYYRAENGTSAACSSAQLTLPDGTLRCEDTKVHYDGNFWQGQTETIPIQSGGSHDVSVKDIYVNGEQDSPAMIWFRFESDNDIDVNCREVIPAEFTTTTTTTSTTTTITTTPTTTPTTTTAPTTTTRPTTTTAPIPTTTTPTTTTTTPTTTITTMPTTTTTTPPPSGSTIPVTNTVSTQRIADADDEEQQRIPLLAILVPLGLLMLTCIFCVCWTPVHLASARYIRICRYGVCRYIRRHLF